MFTVYRFRLLFIAQAGLLLFRTPLFMKLLSTGFCDAIKIAVILFRSRQRTVSSAVQLGTLLICSIYLLAFVTSLQGQTTTNLTVYATSAFAEHSLVATVLVVQGVVNGISFLLSTLLPSFSVRP